MNKMAKEFNKCVSEAIRPYVKLATKVINDMNMEGNKNDINNSNSKSGK